MKECLKSAHWMLENMNKSMGCIMISRNDPFPEAPSHVFTGDQLHIATSSIHFLFCTDWFFKVFLWCFFGGIFRCQITRNPMVVL